MNLFDTNAEEYYEYQEKADGLSHIIGSKDERVHFLPDLSKGFVRDSRRNFSEMEKLSLIEEEGEASNARKLDVKGTHYENQSASEIAMMILPLKGF